MADTPTGETVTPGDSQTTVTTTAAPATDNNSAAEVERLRKEKEQRDLRIRQLENEAAAREKADEEARQKQLEEKEEYKTLYTAEREKRETLESDRQAEEQRTQLTAATDTVFKDYPTEVVDLAKTAGLSLSDDSEAAKAALKVKLDAFKEKVAPNAPTVTSNNPNASAVTPASAPEGRLGRPHTIGTDDEGKSVRGANQQKISAYINAIPGVQQMKRDAGLKVD